MNNIDYINNVHASLNSVCMLILQLKALLARDTVAISGIR